MPKKETKKNTTSSEFDHSLIHTHNLYIHNYNIYDSSSAHQYIHYTGCHTKKTLRIFWKNWMVFSKPVLKLVVNPRHLQKKLAKNVEFMDKIVKKILLKLGQTSYFFTPL